MCGNTFGSEIVTRKQHKQACLHYRGQQKGKQGKNMALKLTTVRARIHFIEEILGTCAADPEVHRTYIASKAPDAASLKEEVEAVGVDGVVENKMTVFPKNANGDCIFWNYQIKGFMKNAQKTLNSYNEKGKFPYLASYKSKIDNLIFIKSCDSTWGQPDRGIVIHWPDDVDSSPDCQRPLRAETAQGPRVALAHSETCPEGSWCEFDVGTLDPKLEKNIREWLDSGVLYGIGQWRNSGKGRFTWEEITE